MTVGELLDRIDSRELSEWMAYERIEPADLWQSACGRLLYWIGCLWSKKPPDYRNFFPKEKREMSPAEMRARLRGQ